MSALESVQAFFHSGGPAMWPLSGCLLALWWTLGWRAAVLMPRARVHATRATEQVHARLRAAGPTERAPVVREAMWSVRDELARYASVVKVLVVCAPLLGLLGTVSGMIETFDSMADMALHSQSGGIAGGIAEALVTTEMGLLVAVPGLLVGRLLARRQHLIEGQLDQLEHTLAAGGAA